MTTVTLQEITPDKGRLRLLVDSLSEHPFYKYNIKVIYDELGLIEIHKLDESLMLLFEAGVVKNTNNGNSYVSYLIGLTTVEPTGVLKTTGGSLPD